MTGDIWIYRFAFDRKKIKLSIIQISSKSNTFCLISLLNSVSLPRRIPCYAFHCYFKSFLYSEVLWLPSALWFRISNLCSANQHHFGVWQERKKVNLCHYIQASESAALSLLADSSLGQTLLTLCFVILCVEREDNISAASLFLGISSHLCFETWLLLEIKEKSKSSIVCKFVWKGPHFHQPSHWLYAFACHPRSAFCFIERVWKLVVK